MSEFSHIDSEGRARMVDVGGKTASDRTAIAGCTVVMAPETLSMLREQALPKGDVLNTARIAGILAAKRTGELIPMCHPIFLSYVDVRFDTSGDDRVVIEAEARTSGQTGVEMEALMAAQMAALTIYDMCKAVQKDIRLEEGRLLYKSGGKSGIFRAE